MTSRSGARRAVDTLGRGLAVLAVAVVLLEVGSWCVLRALTRRALRTPDARQALPQFAGAPWAARYWLENQAVASGVQYRPFVRSRRTPFAGEAIGVDASGLRRTEHTRCEPGSAVIWLFGGSTLWGYGAPDELTIPSLLAERLAQGGSPACVVNFGELGRVSTGEIVDLVQALKTSRARPHVVVLYDGCNDVIAALAHGQADVESDHATFSRMFAVGVRAPEGSFAYLPFTNAGMLAARIAQRLAPPPSPPAPSPDLATAVAGTLRANGRVLEGLAGAHGFAVLHVLQPVALAGGKTLAAAESSRVHGDLPPGAEDALSAVFRGAYAALRASPSASFRDFSGVLDGRADALYFDVCHVTPAANAVVAERLYAEIAALPAAATAP
jgi:lysophospholipase L1-like esterase